MKIEKRSLSRPCPLPALFRSGAGTLPLKAGRPEAAFAAGWKNTL